MLSKKTNYKKYKEAAIRTGEPVRPNSPLFNVKIDLQGLKHYAKKVNKSIGELSKEEQGMFIEGGFEALEKVRGW